MKLDDEKTEAIEFSVRLCGDVFLGVLCFGERRRLTKLERAGRRFHRAVEDFLEMRPFLRLNIGLNRRNQTHVINFFLKYTKSL